MYARGFSGSPLRTYGTVRYPIKYSAFAADWPWPCAACVGYLHKSKYAAAAVDYLQGKNLHAMHAHVHVVNQLCS